ncbi:TPA: DUF3383 family protein [Providencia alcalifaciens]
MKSIPASDIVQILPGVVGTGGNPLALNALFITKKQPASMLGVKAFGSADLVGEVFGKDSKEYEAAQVYFAGFDNCTVLPDTLFIASMVTTAQAAKLVGAKLPTRTSSEFAALPQGLILTIDGQVTSVNFETEVNSYSSLAAAVTTALGSAATCTYDTGAKVFVIEGAALLVQSRWLRVI